LQESATATEPEERVRAYRVELDPTVEQRRQMARQAGAARWTFNWALARWRSRYADASAQYKACKETLDGVKDPVMRAFGDGLLAWKRGREMPSAFGLTTELTQVKKSPETSWLREVSAYVVREAVADVGNAYKHFFRRVKKHGVGDHSECGRRRDGGCALGPPDFRSRKDPAGRGFRIAQPQAIVVEARTVKVAGVGGVKLKERGYVPVGCNARGLSVREQAGRWFAAVQVDEVASPQKPRREGVVLGVEVGVRALAVTSDGKRFGAIRDLEGLAKADRRLALWSRRMARRHVKSKSAREQSAGWQEAVREVQKCHMRIGNIRRDVLNQASTRIVRQRSELIVMRDMDVSEMLARGARKHEVEKRNKLAPMVAKVGMYELRRQVEYKQGWAGGAVLTTPKLHPTTRTCSACGSILETEAAYPDFVCPQCEHAEDRDDNAAKVLKNFGLGNQGGTVPRTAGPKTPRKRSRTAGRTGSPDASRTSPAAGPDGDATSPPGSGNRAGQEVSGLGRAQNTAIQSEGQNLPQRTSLSGPISASIEVMTPSNSPNLRVSEPGLMVDPGPLENTVVSLGSPAGIFASGGDRS
jgi:putative transposase